MEPPMPHHRSFDPECDHLISREEAHGFVRAYQSHSKDPKALKSAVFSHRAYLRLLAQPGCLGIRIYLAQKPDGGQTFVMVGVDAKGHDLDGAEAVYTEHPVPCPPFCEETALGRN